MASLRFCSATVCAVRLLMFLTLFLLSLTSTSVKFKRTQRLTITNFKISFCKFCQPLETLKHCNHVQHEHFARVTRTIFFSRRQRKRRIKAKENNIGYDRGYKKEKPRAVFISFSQSWLRRIHWRLRATCEWTSSILAKLLIFFRKDFTKRTQ